MDSLSLCSGIGGLDLGLRLAVPNYRTVCYVENDSTCQDVLRARMADGLLDPAPLWGDLKLFDARPWRGLVDLVHGGYPCQPFSTEGRRRGADDDRYLWPAVRDVVRDCEPEWCLFENVDGHLSLGASEVVRDLVGMGFRVAMGTFTAAECGAPHERKRLYILAHADPLRGRGPEPDHRGALVEHPRPYPRAWPPRPRDPDWRRVVTLDPSLAPKVEEEDGWQLNPAFAEWLMGFPRGWTEGFERVARLKMLGNAVVPCMAALAWEELSLAVNRPEIVEEEI